MNADDRQFEIARSLFREANDAFFLFDPRTQVVIDLNPAAQRLTGLDRQQACTKSLRDLFFSRGSGDLDRLALALNRTGFFHSREGYYSSKSLWRVAAGQHQCEPDSHRARTGRAGRGPRHQRAEAGARGPPAGGGPVQQPGRVDRCRRLGDRWPGNRGLPEPGLRDNHGLAPRRLDRTPSSTRWFSPKTSKWPRDFIERAMRGEIVAPLRAADPHPVRESADQRVLAGCQDGRRRPGMARGNQPGHHRTETRREGTRAGRTDAPGPGCRRAGQPGQERVSVQCQPRDSHPAQRTSRLQRAAFGTSLYSARTARDRGVSPQYPGTWPVAPGADR